MNLGDRKSRKSVMSKYMSSDPEDDDDDHFAAKSQSVLFSDPSDDSISPAATSKNSSSRGKTSFLKMWRPRIAKLQNSLKYAAVYCLLVIVDVMLSFMSAIFLAARGGYEWQIWIFVPISICYDLHVLGRIFAGGRKFYRYGKSEMAQRKVQTMCCGLLKSKKYRLFNIINLGVCSLSTCICFTMLAFFFNGQRFKKDVHQSQGFRWIFLTTLIVRVFWGIYAVFKAFSRLLEVGGKEKGKLVLDSILGNLFSISTDNIIVDALNGKIFAKNLEFNSEEWDKLHSPLIVKIGFIERIEIQAPVKERIREIVRATMPWLRKNARRDGPNGAADKEDEDGKTTRDHSEAAAAAEKKEKKELAEGEKTFKIHIKNMLVVISPKSFSETEEEILYGRDQAVTNLVKYMRMTGTLATLVPPQHKKFLVPSTLVEREKANIKKLLKEKLGSNLDIEFHNVVLQIEAEAPFVHRPIQFTTSFTFFCIKVRECRKCQICHWKNTTGKRYQIKNKEKKPENPHRGVTTDSELKKRNSGHMTGARDSGAIPPKINVLQVSISDGTRGISGAGSDQQSSSGQQNNLGFLREAWNRSASRSGTNLSVGLTSGKDLGASFAPSTSSSFAKIGEVEKEKIPNRCTTASLHNFLVNADTSYVSFVRDIPKKSVFEAFTRYWDDRARFPWVDGGHLFLASNYAPKHLNIANNQQRFFAGGYEQKQLVKDYKAAACMDLSRDFIIRPVAVNFHMETKCVGPENSKVQNGDLFIEEANKASQLDVALSKQQVQELISLRKFMKEWHLLNASLMTRPPPLTGDETNLERQSRARQMWRHAMRALQLRTRLTDRKYSAWIEMGLVSGWIRHYAEVREHQETLAYHRMPPEPYFDSVVRNIRMRLSLVQLLSMEALARQNMIGYINRVNAWRVEREARKKKRSRKSKDSRGDEIVVDDLATLEDLEEGTILTTTGGEDTPRMIDFDSEPPISRLSTVDTSTKQIHGKYVPIRRGLSAPPISRPSMASVKECGALEAQTSSKDELDITVRKFRVEIDLSDDGRNILHFGVFVGATYQKFPEVQWMATIRLTHVLATSENHPKLILQTMGPEERDGGVAHKTVDALSLPINRAKKNETLGGRNDQKKRANSTRITTSGAESTPDEDISGGMDDGSPYFYDEPHFLTEPANVIITVTNRLPSRHAIEGGKQKSLDVKIKTGKINIMADGWQNSIQAFFKFPLTEQETFFKVGKPQLHPLLKTQRLVEKLLKTPKPDDESLFSLDLDQVTLVSIFPYSQTTSLLSKITFEPWVANLQQSFGEIFELSAARQVADASLYVIPTSSVDDVLNAGTGDLEITERRPSNATER